MSSRRLPPLMALRAFEVAARRLSFAKAADELAVTPAAISHQVRKLEEHVDRSLFVRSHRAIALTPAGLELAASLHRLFGELRLAVDALEDPSRDTLRISVMPSLAAKWLAPRIVGFQVARPDVSLRVDATDAITDFSTESVDLALRYGRGRHPGHQVDRLFEAAAIPVCSPTFLARHRGRLKRPIDVGRVALLHDETDHLDSGIPNWERWLAAVGAAPTDIRRGVVFGDASLAIDAAVAGHGMAIGIGPLVAGDLAAGRLVCPFPIAVPNGFAFWIVSPKRGGSQRRIVAFRRWLLDEADATRRDLAALGQPSSAS